MKSSIRAAVLLAFASALTIFVWSGALAPMAPMAPMAALAQDDAASAERSERALKYHGVLVKRPSSGYLFDRFFGAWLASGTVESLETFLRERGEAEQAGTGDHLLLAFFYTKQGEDAKALEVFAKALAADPGNAEAWLEKARAEARTLDFDTALGDLDQATEAEPDDEQAAEIGKLRGRLLVRAGRSEEALQVWRALLAERVDDEELHEDVIELLVDEGLYDEAIATAEKLTEATVDPYRKVQRRLVVGDLYQRSGNREEALVAYSASLGKTGHGTWIEREIIAQIEQLFRREDDIAGLSIYLEQLLEKDQRRMALRQRQAAVLAEQGEQDLAIEAWKEILELTPGDRAVRESYVAVLAKMERFEEAVAQMQALAKLHSEDGELRVALAELQHAAGDSEAAGKTVAEFLVASDRSEYAYLRAARLLQRFELSKQAESVFAELLAAFPDSVGARETFANFLFDSKRRDEALAIWKGLAATDDVTQLVRVGRALAARGEFEEAFSMLRERYDSLNSDPVYLAQLIDLALRAKQAEAAFEWLQRRLLMVESADELTDVTAQALLVMRQTGDEKHYVETLRGSAGAEGLSVRESCLLAELLNQSGDEDAADEALGTIVTAESSNDDDKLLALAQQARLFELRKDWSGAADALRAAVELPGGLKSSNVQTLVGYYQRSLQTEEALRWIGEWKKLSPGSSEPWLREASVLWASGKVDDGLSTLRSAARRFEDSEEVRLQLADSLVDAGKVADAELIYWQLYDEAEDSLKKLNWVGKLGELSAQSGRLEHLIERFEERKRQNRASVVPLLALAEIYRVDERYEERRQAILEASRLQPNDVGLLHQLAGVDEAEGNVEGALKSLHAALEVDATGRTRQRIVRLYFLTGQYEKALEALQAGSGGGLAATDPYLVEEVYAQIIRGGEWERAVEFLQPFLVAHPDNYRLHYLNAVALEEGEQFGRARDAFISLLDFDEEVAPPANAASNQQQQTRYIMYAGSYYTDAEALEKARRELERLYPAEALEIQELQTSTQFAYHYREGHGEGRIYGFGENRYRGWGYGGSNQVVLPPEKLEAVRPITFSHLMKLSSKGSAAGGGGGGEPTGTGSGSGAVMELAEQHGFPSLYLEWLKRSEAAEDLPEEEQAQIFSKWLAENPDNETLHALWAMGWAARGEAVDSLAEAKRVFDLFAESRPALAFNAACAGAMSVLYQEQPEVEKQQAARALMDRAIEIAPRIDYVPTMTFQQAYNQLRYDYQLQMAGNTGGREPVLSTEQRKALRTVLKQWEPELSARNQTSAQYRWLSVSLLYLSALEGDMESFVRGLEAEAQRHREEAQKAAAGGVTAQVSAQLMSHQRSGSLIVPLTFPPQGLPDVSAAVVAYMGENSRNYSGGQDWATEENLKKLAALLPSIKDPVLRVLAAHRLGEDGDEIKAAGIAELADADPPTASGLMLAAAQAATQDEADPDTASELLDKARYLAMPALTSRYIDGALVSLGLEAEKDSPRFEKGKAAALRMRASLKPDQRNEARELAETLRQFGLDKEASRLSLAAARAQSAQSSGSGSGIGLAAMAAAQNPEMVAAKLKQLVEQDKRDMAIKTGVTQIKQIATGLLGQESSYLEYQLRELREVLESASLTSEILTAAEPGDDAKLVDRVQFAALCDAVGSEDGAIEAYEELIAERPQDDALRLRLVILLCSRDLDAALAHLDGVKSVDLLGSVGEALAERIDNAETFARRFELAEVALRFLEQRADQFQEHHLHWVEDVRSEIANEGYAEDMRLPPLLRRWRIEDYERYDNYKEETFQAMIKRREDLHERYCLAMMKLPDQAPAGFTYLAAVKTEAGEDPEVLVAMAREVLGDMEGAAFFGNGFSLQPNGSSSWGGGSRNADDLRIRGPIETLVSHAFTTDKRALVYDEVLPELEKSPKRKAVADAVRAYADLYFCEPDRFADAIDALEKVGGSYGARFALLLASDAYRERDIDFDLRPKIEATLQSQESRTRGLEDVLPNLLSAVAERKGSAAAIELIEVYAEALLGPAEQRLDFIKKHYKANSWSGNTPNGDIHTFEEFLGNCGNHPRLIFPALGYAAALKRGRGGRVYQLEYPFQDASYMKREGFLEPWLSTSPLVLTDLADFDPVGGSAFQRISQRGKRTVIGQMIDLLGGQKDKAREPIEKFIAAVGTPLPFGLRLVASRWEKNPSLAAVKIFHEVSTSIAALPEDRQAALAEMAVDLIDPAKLPKDLDAGVAESWQHYQELAGATAAGELEEFMAAESIEDLNIRSYQLDDRAEPLIKKLLTRDVAQATAALAKTLELVEHARRTGGSVSRYSGGRNFGGELLDDIEQSSAPLDVLRFEIAIVTSEDLPPLTIFTRPKYSNMARKLGEGSSNKKASEQVEHFKNRLAEIAAAIGEGAPPVADLLIAPLLYEMLNSYLDGVSALVLEWATSDDARATHPRLALEAELAARRVVAVKAYKQDARPTTKKGDRPPLPAEADAHYLQFIADATLPANVRLMLVSHVLGGDAPEVSDALLAASIDLLAECWSGDIPVVDGQAQLVLDRWLEGGEMPQRKELGSKLASAFQMRYLSGRAPARLQSDPGEALVMGMLRLNLGNDNVAAANQLLSRFENRIGDFTPAFRTLVVAGEYASAARLLRKHSDKIGDRLEGATWSRELDAATGAFLDTITRTETRLLAHAVLGATPDPKVAASTAGEEPVEAAGSTRSQRLRQVAEDTVAAGAAGELRNVLAREQLLRLIALEPEAAKVAAGMYREAVADLHFGTLFKLDDDRARMRKLSLMESDLLLSLIRGEAESYATRVVEAFEAPSSSSYYKRQFLNRMVKLPYRALDEALYPADTVVALFPAWSPLFLEVSMTREIGAPDFLMGRLLFAAAESDQLAAFFSWIEGHGEEDREKMEANLRRAGQGFFKTAAEYYRGHKRGIEDRKTLLNRLFANPAVDKRHLGMGTTSFLQAITHKLLTLDEVMEHGLAMAEVAPRHGFAWADMAVAHERKNRWDESVKFWERAVAVGIEVKRSLPTNRFRVGYAAALLKVDRKEEARAAIESITRTNVAAGQLKTVDRVRKALGMKALPAADGKDAKEK